MNIIDRGPEDHVVVLWRRGCCSAIGHGTCFGAGYGFMRSLLRWLGWVFSSSHVL